MGWLGTGGQFDCHFQSRGRAIFGADGAAAVLDAAADYCQAEACASRFPVSVRFGTVKRFEQVWDAVFGDSWAAIGDHDLDGSVYGSCNDLDGAGVCGISERVSDQVAEGPFQKTGVSPNEEV